LSIAKTSGLQTALDSKMTTASYSDLVAIEALTGTTGLLRKTAANAWSLDTANYQTSTQVSSAINARFYIPEGYQAGIEPMMYYNTGNARMEAMEYAWYDGNYNFFGGGALGGGAIICDTINPSNITLSNGGGSNGQFIKKGSFSISWSSLSVSDIPSLSSLYQPINISLTNFLALSGTGIVKKTGTTSWSLDSSDYLTRTYTGTTSPNGYNGAMGQVLATTGTTDYWLSLTQEHVNFRYYEVRSDGFQYWNGLRALGFWTGAINNSNYNYAIKSGHNETLNRYGWSIIYPTGTYSNYFDDLGRLSYITPDGISRRYLIEGEGGGNTVSVTPSLQDVSIVGRNSNQRLQYNFVDYALVSDIVTLSQNLDSVLLNGNTANNKNIFLNGLNSAYTLGYDGTSKFMINHTTAGVLNMTQTAGTQFNITAASLLNVLANDIILTANNGIFIGGNNTNVDIQSELVAIASQTTLALSSGSGDLNVLSNTGFVNLGYYNPQYSKTRLGRPDSGDYIYMNGQKYNFSLPTVSSGDYLVMQINGTDVTVKKATIFASGGKNYLTV
jgi:hypothetical protein